MITNGARVGEEPIQRYDGRDPGEDREKRKESDAARRGRIRSAEIDQNTRQRISSTRAQGSPPGCWPRAPGHVHGPARDRRRPALASLANLSAPVIRLRGRC